MFNFKVHIKDDTFLKKIKSNIFILYDTFILSIFIYVNLLRKHLESYFINF